VQHREHRGRKAFRLQSLAPSTAPDSPDRVAQASGFSLHAGVAAEAGQRDKLERLCRYISRPAVAIERLSRTTDGRIRYALKSPYRDGTPHGMFEPLDLLARLAALVPSPGVNLTRYHGAPNHRLRALIVPSGRGRGGPGTAGQGSANLQHVSMSWAQRLKRVFGIEIERCAECGGALKIIASKTPRSSAAFFSTWGLLTARTAASAGPPCARRRADQSSDSSSPIRCSCGSRSVVRYGIAPRCREPRTRSVLRAPWARHAATIAETQLDQPPLAVAMPTPPNPEFKPCATRACNTQFMVPIPEKAK
jgi:hypothetical protein